MIDNGLEAIAFRPSRIGVSRTSHRLTGAAQARGRPPGRRAWQARAARRRRGAELPWRGRRGRTGPPRGGTWCTGGDPIGQWPRVHSAHTRPVGVQVRRPARSGGRASRSTTRRSSRCRGGSERSVSRSIGSSASPRRVRSSCAGATSTTITDAIALANVTSVQLSTGGAFRPGRHRLRNSHA